MLPADIFTISEADCQSAPTPKNLVMRDRLKTCGRSPTAISLTAFVLLIGATQPTFAADCGVHGRVIAIDDRGMPTGVVSGAAIELRNQAGVSAATVISGEGGYYKIDLSPGRYTYKVTAPGYKDEDQGRGIALQLSEGYAVFNLTLVKGENDPSRKPPDVPNVQVGELSGHVVEVTSDGERVGIPGATVSLRGPGDGRMLMQVVTADGDAETGEGRGQYRLTLTAGTWRAAVSADGFQTVVVPDAITIEPDKTFTRDFVLRRDVVEPPKNQGVKVKAVFADPSLESEELPAIRVYATPFGDAAELEDPLTQDDTQYFWRDLPAGTYQIGAMAEGYRSVRSGPTEVFPGKYTFVHLTLSRDVAPEPPPESSSIQGIRGSVWVNDPNATVERVALVLAHTEVYIVPADQEAKLEDPLLLNGQGAFSRDLPVGRYSVMAVAREYKMASLNAVEVVAGRHTMVRLTLVPEGEAEPPQENLVFEGLVYELLPDGQQRQPLPDAIVLIRRSDQSLTDAPRGTTNKEGKVSIEVDRPGSHTVLAQKAGYQPNGMRVTIAVDGPNKRVITLTKKPELTDPPVMPPPSRKPVTVTGYVVYRDPTSSTGLMGLEDAKLRWLRQGGDLSQLREVDTERAGRFSIQLPEGTYQVDVYPPPGYESRFMGASERLVVTHGMPPKYFYLDPRGGTSPPSEPEPPVDNRVLVRGFVMAKTAQGQIAVPNTRLIWTQGLQDAMSAVTTDIRGQFTIRLEPAVYEVAIEGPPGYNSDRDRVHVAPNMSSKYFYLVHQAPTPPDDSDVASLRVRVLEAGTAQPLQGAKVQILQSNRSFNWGNADPQGYASFNLKPGSYEILTTHAGYEGDRGMVNLKAGTTSHNVNLKRSGPPPQTPVTLNVQVGGLDSQGKQIKLLSGASVQVMQSGRTQASGTTNYNGVFTARLKPGAYRISVAHQAYLPGQDNVTLAGATVDRRVLLKPKNQMIPATQVKLNVQVGGIDPKGSNRVSLVDGAHVNITQNGRSIASGSTNSAGVFSAQLVPGRYQIQATHGAYYPGSASVTLTKDAVDQRILLRPKTQIK